MSESTMKTSVTDKATGEDRDELIARLAREADVARCEHGKVCGAHRRSLIHARRAGKWLRQAKDTLARLHGTSHGRWLACLHAWGIPDRSAQVYLQIEEGWPTIEKWMASKSVLPTDLTLTEARAVLAKARTPERAATPTQNAIHAESEEPPQIPADQTDESEPILADGGQEGTELAETKTEVDPDTEMEKWTVGPLPHSRMTQLKRQIEQLMPVYKMDVPAEALAQAVAVAFAAAFGDEQQTDVAA